MTGKKIINKERRRMDLRPIRDVYDNIMGKNLILATDEVFGSAPEDVKQRVYQVGHLPLHHNEELSSDLKAFLNSGSPPIFVGFGSMPNVDPDATARLWLDVARATNNRLILSRGWGNLRLTEKGDDYFCVDNVPHDKLFQRVAMVVHHGGAGTTATAARAGVPQIIIPHLLDQFYWVNQIARNNIGPQFITTSQYMSNYSVESLSKVVNECLSSEIIIRETKRISEKLKNYDSLGKAVNLIESGVLTQK